MAGILLFAGCSSPDRSASTQPRGGSLAGTVTRVVDGDTVWFRPDGRPNTTLKVRIVGIDTPELQGPDGPACYAVPAQKLLAKAVLNGPVRIELAVDPLDRFGRTLADIVPSEGAVKGNSVAAHMVASGAARTLTIEPNIKNAGRLAALQRTARRSKRGLWGACSERDAFRSR